MSNNILKKTLYIFIILIISLGISLLISSPLIQSLNTITIEITPDNYKDVKSRITDSSIVEIEGTINPYNLVGDNSDPNKITTYYAGLNEYGNNFIVKFKPGRLSSSKQKFIGKIIKLGDDDFSNNLINAINAPINSNSNVDSMLQKEFDSTVINKIADYSKANYDKSAIVIMDGQFIANQQIYLNIIISFVLLSIVLIVLFRKKIFKSGSERILIDYHSHSS